MNDTQIEDKVAGIINVLEGYRDEVTESENILAVRQALMLTEEIGEFTHSL